METVEKTRRKFDYKWVIMAVSFLMVFTGLGFCSGTKSLFFKISSVQFSVFAD